MCYDRLGDLHVGTHDDGAGAFVHDDLGLRIRFHGQLLHGGDELCDLVEIGLLLGEVDGHQPGIFGHGGGAGGGIDGFGDAPGGGEVGLAQRQLQHAVLKEGHVLALA